MRHCLSLSKWSARTNHRNHALKAKTLLSLSGCGRGFGSVFHHHNLKSQPLSVGIFFARSASSRVLLGVPAEACGLRQPPELPVPGHIPLSPGHSSLRPRFLKLARSPQRPQIRPIQIKDLRADESSGWIAVLATGGNRFALMTHLYQRVQQCPSSEPTASQDVNYTVKC